MDDPAPKTFPHHIAGYVGSGLSVAALLIAMGSTPVGTHDTARPRVDRFEWPALAEQSTKAMADALNGKPPGQVTLYCASYECHDFRLDLDDAFHLAGWKTDNADYPVESEQDDGIAVGPAGPEAEALAKAIKDTTGIEPKIVGIGDKYGNDIKGVGLIIGKANPQ